MNMKKAVSASTSVARRGSLAANVIESAWANLQRIDPRIPDVVVVILPAEARPSKKGHFGPCRWRSDSAAGAHELAVSPSLFADPTSLLATLVHEAAHAVLTNIGDRNGGCAGKGHYYHRKEFRDVCKALGLDCFFRNTRYGWTSTGWPEAGVDPRYRVILEFLRKKIPAGGGLHVPTAVQPQPLPPSGRIRLACSCKNARSIYVGRAVSAAGAITCGVRKKEFRQTK